THTTEPARLNAANCANPIRVAPASGGAISDRPGTNLATNRALPPQRSKRVWVWLTQESGVREMRHNSFITRLPYRRPDRYHAVSPMKQAATAPMQSAL